MQRMAYELINVASKWCDAACPAEAAWDAFTQLLTHARGTAPLDVRAELLVFVRQAATASHWDLMSAVWDAAREAGCFYRLDEVQALVTLSLADVDGVGAWVAGLETWVADAAFASHDDAPALLARALCDLADAICESRCAAVARSGPDEDADGDADGDGASAASGDDRSSASASTAWTFSYTPAAERLTLSPFVAALFASPRIAEARRAMFAAGGPWLAAIVNAVLDSGDVDEYHALAAAFRDCADTPVLGARGGAGALDPLVELLEHADDGHVKAAVLARISHAPRAPLGLASAPSPAVRRWSVASTGSAGDDAQALEPPAKRACVPGGTGATGVGATVAAGV